MLQSTAQALVDAVVSASSDLLFPLMFFGFGGSIFLKALVVFTIRRQWWFAKEFEKRLVRHLESKELVRQGSFFVTLKKILERTYYELFEVRGIMMRRKLDYVTSPIDRLFAIQHGSALIVKDTLHEVKFLHKDRDPPFVDVAKSVCSKNPCFGKLFGWIPIGPLNDLLNLVPGLFIIGGIFGTFLGIMEALPELSMLDLKNADASKIVMDTFLLKISFSISTSIVGIIFSVCLTVFYSLTAAEKTFVKVVDVYTRCLTRLWEASESNVIPEKIEEFDEHRDPLEALAHMAVAKGAQSAAIAKSGEERKAS